MAGGKGITHPGNPTETLEAFIARIIATTGAKPTVETATFSGEDKDWQKDENAVYMRLQSHGRLDGAGESYEVWARLCAPAGVWRIPRVPTEMMLIAAPYTDESPGTGWCFATAQNPPDKLDRDHAYMDIDEDTWLLTRAGGWAVKVGEVTVGIEKGTSKFQVSGAGCYFAFNPDGPSFEWVIGNGAVPNAVLCALKLSPVGVELVVSNASGTTKQTWKIGADGHTTTFATGQYTFGAKAGVILGVPSGPPSPLVIWNAATGLPQASLQHSVSG